MRQHAVGKVDISIILTTANDHRDHLGRGMSKSLGTAVVIEVARACGDIANAQELVQCVREVGTYLLSMI